MEKYGLIVCNETGAAAQVEKVNYDTAQALLSGFGTLAGVGVSLGSFSVSSVLLLSLLDEFATELKEKKGKLDSDPHLWMPMTLSRESYLMVMEKKGVDKVRFEPRPSKRGGERERGREGGGERKREGKRGEERGREGKRGEGSAREGKMVQGRAREGKRGQDTPR